MSAAEFVIHASDIVAAQVDGASVTLSFTPAKTAELAQLPKDSLNIRLLPPVHSKDVYFSAVTPFTVTFHFPDAAAAAAFATTCTKGEKKP
jgi:hypothetical protein